MRHVNSIAIVPPKPMGREQKSGHHQLAGRRHAKLMVELLEERRLFNTAPVLAQVTTDQADYPPGATAVISATGYKSGETVRFQVLQIDAQGNDISNLAQAGHEPWQVTDGGAGDLDPLPGGVRTTWFMHNHFAYTTLKATATGLISGLTSQTIPRGVANSLGQGGS